MATLTQVFTSLADKIRSKLGTTTKYTPAQAISAIDDVYEKGKSEGTTPTQEKTVTAGTSASTVTPDSGYALSKVTVNPTPSQTKSASPSTSAQTISPDSGKLLSSVSISAISPQRNPQTANQATYSGYNATGPFVFFPEGWWPSQHATYGSFVYMTQALAQAAHPHTGTRASVTSNGTIDLGVTHNIRYVPVSVSGSGVVPVNASASHSINSNANTISLRYYDIASKSFKTASTTVYGSTSQFGRGSWGFSLGGIGCAVTISEISVGSGSMVRFSMNTSATSAAPALSGYADYNVPNSSYAYAMTAPLS